MYIYINIYIDADNCDSFSQFEHIYFQSQLVQTQTRKQQSHSKNIFSIPILFKMQIFFHYFYVEIPFYSAVEHKSVVASMRLKRISLQ